MDPVEIVYDLMSVEDWEKLLPPIFFPDKGQEWPESTTAGLGVLPLVKEQQQPFSSSSSSPSPMTTQWHVEQHPNNSFHSILNDLPIIEEFHDDTVYHHSHHSHYSQSPTTSFDIAAAASLHMMPHDFNNLNHWPEQNYCGYTNTAGSDMMLPHDFNNSNQNYCGYASSDMMMPHHFNNPNQNCCGLGYISTVDSDMSDFGNIC